MAIYLITYAVYFAILSVGLARKNTRRWVVAATLPMLALVLLRGNVGVDLPMYVQSIALIQEKESLLFIFEPGFELLILGLANISNTPEIIAKLIATLTTALLLFNKWRTKTAYQTLGLGIIPYFYLDMTMNGLRYGLAFATTLVALNFLLTIRRVRYIFLSLIAASVQVTSLYLTALTQLFLKPSWKYILPTILVLPAVATLGSDYFLYKVSANAELGKPGVTAGLAPLLLSSLMLTGCWSDRRLRALYRTRLLALAALTLLTYGVTQLSYAGLRLQQMNYFFILLFVIYASESLNRKNSKFLLITLILTSILGSTFRLHNFYSDAGNGEAPFVPYKFYWSE